MRIFLITIAVLVVGFFACLGWYFWDSSHNRSLKFGYYGEFNRLSNTLASIPGVVVTDFWYNDDVTLEGIGFKLTFTGEPIDLFFGQNDSIRDMNRAAAITALQARISAALALSQTNR